MTMRSALSTHGLFLLATLLLALPALVALLAADAVGAGLLPLLVLALSLLSLRAWALLSEQQPGSPLGQRYAWTVLVLAATLRGGADLLRLAPLRRWTRQLDGYALAILAGLERRGEAAPSARLALLLALSLPVERVLQRQLGTLLQQGSGAAVEWPLLSVLIAFAGGLVLRARRAPPALPSGACARDAAPRIEDDARAVAGAAGPGR